MAAPDMTPVAPPPAPATAEGARDGEGRRRVRDIREVHDQIYVFLEKNRAVESSRPLEEHWDEIARCRSLNKVFSQSVEAHLLTMDQAHRFMLYMVTDVGPLLENLVADGNLEPLEKPSPFRADRALTLVADYYDLGVAHLAGPPEDSDEEDSDDGSGLDEVDEEEAGVGAGS